MGVQLDDLVGISARRVGYGDADPGCIAARDLRSIDLKAEVFE
jgi:hypothetical protein